MHETVNLVATRLDDDINVIDVEASGRHICANEDAPGAGLFELGQRILTIGLRQVAVNGKELGKLLITERSRLLLCLCEDECFQIRIRRHEIMNVRQLRREVSSHRYDVPELRRKLGLIVADQVNHDRRLHAVSGDLLDEVWDRG